MSIITETLEYETPHFLQSLIANDLGLLKHLATELDLVVTSRDGWVKFQGTNNGVDAAKRVFTQLETARRDGADINAHFFKFALTSAQAEDSAATGSGLQELTSVKVR